jgi:hypothetical protein
MMENLEKEKDEFSAVKPQFTIYIRKMTASMSVSPYSKTKQTTATIKSPQALYTL